MHLWSGPVTLWFNNFHDNLLSRKRVQIPYLGLSYFSNGSLLSGKGKMAQTSCKPLMKAMHSPQKNVHTSLYSHCHPFWQVIWDPGVPPKQRGLTSHLSFCLSLCSQGLMLLAPCFVFPHSGPLHMMLLLPFRTTRKKQASPFWLVHFSSNLRWRSISSMNLNTHSTGFWDMEHAQLVIFVLSTPSKCTAHNKGSRNTFQWMNFQGTPMYIYTGEQYCDTREKLLPTVPESTWALVQVLAAPC